MKKSALDLTKKLVTIPSYLSRDTNEIRAAEFVMSFLKECPSITRISRQMVEGGRFNVIAETSGKPKLLFACHLDTVGPVTGGKYDPLKPTRVRDKLFGLGAKDMKGGLACVLAAIASFKHLEGLALLFYVDEETNLKGMKKFVSELAFRPDLIISPESTFEIANGRRGIITIDLIVKGKSAHTARPKLGINAIESFYGLFEELRRAISRFRDPKLGWPSCSITYAHGGSTSELNQEIERRVNLVPDSLKTTISVRTPRKELNARWVIKAIYSLAKKRRLKIKEFNIIHDYSASFVPKERLIKLETAIRESGLEPKYSKNIQFSGYNDVALIYEKTKSDFVNFGPYGGGNHSPEEWVSINSLDRTKMIFEKLITNMQEK